MSTSLFALALLTLATQTPEVQVTAEEDVYTFVNPNNGSGPLWAYGSTEVARTGKGVYICQMETGKDIPPLSNTRWRLLERGNQSWTCVSEPDRYIQREPCPIAVIGDTIYLSVNDSTQPEGTKYGNCEPHVLKFLTNEGKLEQTKLSPVWEKPHTFTDHSYRGFAADPASGHVLMLNIDAKTSEENACLMNEAGETLGGASIAFPIRACYPQVALRGNAVHVMAVGDIVEPVEEWRQYKFDQTQQHWDYVFRILYYTSTPDVATTEFAAPLEIANVDKTAGHISNQDLWLSPEGEAWLMYTQCETASALMRDKFFPGNSLISSLHLAVVKEGAVQTRRVLFPGTDAAQAGHARFQVTTNGTVYAVLYISGADGGNKLLQVYPVIENPPLIPIPAKKPIPSFCLATVRAGNKPSDTVDMLGQTSGDTMSYMQFTIH